MGLTGCDQDKVTKRVDTMTADSPTGAVGTFLLWGRSPAGERGVGEGEAVVREKRCERRASEKCMRMLSVGVLEIAPMKSCELLIQ